MTVHGGGKLAESGVDLLVATTFPATLAVAADLLVSIPMNGATGGFRGADCGSIYRPGQ